MWKTITLDEERLKGLDGIRRMENFVDNVLNAMHNTNPEIDPNVGTSNSQVPNEEDDAQPDSEILGDNNSMEEDENDALEEDTPAGNLDTLITQYESPELNEKIIIAPGEGRSPQDMLEEKYAEELSFPCIFAGVPKLELKNRTKKFTKSDEVCWELRCADRRVPRNICNLFFKNFQKQKNSLREIMYLKLRRKNQPSQVQLNAGILKDKAALKSLAQSDVILPEFKNIRGSPQYWLGAKRDLFATLRQLGQPIFFYIVFYGGHKINPLKNHTFQNSGQH